MFRNYLVTAFRNLLNQKFYALINIGGLAIALAVRIAIANPIHALRYE